MTLQVLAGPGGHPGLPGHCSLLQPSRPTLRRRANVDLVSACSAEEDGLDSRGCGPRLGSDGSAFSPQAPTSGSEGGAARPLPHPRYRSTSSPGRKRDGMGLSAVGAQAANAQDLMPPWVA